MKKNLLILSALVVISLAIVSGGQVPCDGITSMAECPLAGCGRGDAKLNAMKNRTDDSPPNIQVRTLAQMRAFSEPASWPRNRDRTELAFREGRGVVVKAVLLDAHLSGKETTNCKLGGEANKDIHLDLGTFASSPKSSVVAAEITPRLRKEGWDMDKLEHLGHENYYVRITGWYLLDTMHISNPLVRATNWEIHPVTKFEVCTLTRTKCNQGLGWVNLEDWENEE